MGRITTNIYDKKLKEYKEKQQEIIEEMQRHNFADENYYIAINQVLSVAQRAYEIFKSSELNEKRQLLNYLLQNCRLEGKNLLFTMKKPFDALVSYSECSQMLRTVNNVRTIFERQNEYIYIPDLRNYPNA